MSACSSAGSSRLAASTTRPVRAGKIGSALAGPGLSSNARANWMPIMRRSVPAMLLHQWFARSLRFSLELHLRHFGRLFRHGKVLHGFGVRVEDRTPPSSGNSPEFGIIILHGGDIIAPRNGNAVFG